MSEEKTKKIRFYVAILSLFLTISIGSFKLYEYKIATDEHKKKLEKISEKDFFNNKAKNIFNEAVSLTNKETIDGYREGIKKLKKIDPSYDNYENILNTIKNWDNKIEFLEKKEKDIKEENNKQVAKLNSEKKNLSQDKIIESNVNNQITDYYEYFKKLDKDFSDFWDYLNKKLDSDSRKKLLNEQLDWIKNKDIKCNLKNNEEYPPKNEDKIFCLSEETKRRMEVLNYYNQFGYR